ncbi:MAG: histidine kinase [Flavobacteriaceae bacterium]|nr:histidine kinase [Flavobacteriaceae bacterium]
MKAVTPEKSRLLYKFSARETLFHLGFWIVYLLFPFLKSVGRGKASYDFYSEFNDLFFGILVFYISLLFVFPSKNKFRNIFILFILFCILGYINLKTHNWLLQGNHEESFFSYYAIGYISTYTIISLFAYTLYSIKESYKKQILLEDINNQKKQAELSALKSQINPHFLFNTLNTIYSSALKNDEKTAELILKLSDNFRYVLQEGQKEYVSLKKEIRHLKDYISLQKERLSDKINVDFQINADNYQQDISPLLLISFVENAFKYASILRGSIIIIKISLENGEFTFICENTFNKKKEIDAGWKESGIGITNTKRRLEHLYPNNHQLDISKENNIFKVILNIKL